MIGRRQLLSGAQRGWLRTIALVTVHCLPWGLTYPAVKAGLHDSSPLMLAFAARIVGLIPCLLLGERLHPLVLACGALAATGIALVNRSATPSPDADPNTLEGALGEAVLPAEDVT